MTLQGILIDLGGVLHNFTWEQAAGVLNVSTEAYVDALISERENYLDRYQTGRIDIRAFGSYVLQRLRMNANAQTLQTFSSSLKAIWDDPDQEMIALIQRIKEDTTTAVLSNAFPELERRVNGCDQKTGYLAPFKPHLYFSHHIGARKPETAAYQHVVENTGIGYTGWLFVDDKGANVEAAVELGMTGHIFTDANALESTLSHYKFLK